MCTHVETFWMFPCSIQSLCESRCVATSADLKLWRCDCDKNNPANEIIKTST